MRRPTDPPPTDLACVKPSEDEARVSLDQHRLTAPEGPPKSQRRFGRQGFDIPEPGSPGFVVFPRPALVGLVNGHNF